MEFVTSAQMRAIENTAIESGQVTGRALMERAGAGVVAAMRAHWPDLAQYRPWALVLCGPGNNGGDGFVIARMLQAQGWTLTLCLAAQEPARLPPDARANYTAWTALGPVHPLTDQVLSKAAEHAQAGGADPCVVIDALFGIGQRAPMDDLLAPVHRFIAARVEIGMAPLIVAVDVPTGYDADSGAPLATRPMPADLVVTFHARKPIHALPQMADATVVVVDIGLPTTGGADVAANPERNPDNA